MIASCQFHTLHDDDDFGLEKFLSSRWKKNEVGALWNWNSLNEGGCTAKGLGFVGRWWQWWLCQIHTLHDDLAFSEIREFQVKKNEVGALLQVRILEDDDNVSANSSSNDDDDSGFSRISSIRWSYCWAWATLPEILNPKLESNLWVAGFLQSGEAAAELEQFFLRSWTLNPNPIHRWQDFFNQVKQLLSLRHSSWRPIP